VLGGLLALLASLCWGTSDFVAGVQSRRSSVWAAALIGQSAAAVGSVSLLLVLGPERPAARVLAVVALGGVSSAVGVFASYRALALTKMSVAAPIFAAAALVPVLWGIGHGERPGALPLAGIAVTILGIALISSPASEPAPERVPANRTGVLLAVIAALALGLMLVAFGYGAARDPYWTVAVMRCSATLCVLVALAAARPRLGVTRRGAAWLVVAGLLIFVANVLFTVATTKGDLSVVAVLGWLGPGVTALWAATLLRERLRPVQWLAVALVLTGVVCLTLA
jgi:drug/metabolite transporter (DMT)-like permease